MVSVINYEGVCKKHWFSTEKARSCFPRFLYSHRNHIKIWICQETYFIEMESNMEIPTMRMWMWELLWLYWNREMSEENKKTTELMWLNMIRVPVESIRFTFGRNWDISQSFHLFKIFFSPYFSFCGQIQCTEMNVIENCAGVCLCKVFNLKMASVFFRNDSLEQDLLSWLCPLTWRCAAAPGQRRPWPSSHQR